MALTTSKTDQPTLAKQSPPQPAALPGVEISQDTSASPSQSSSEAQRPEADKPSRQNVSKFYMVYDYRR
jgi:hypothetical protein